MTAKHLLVALLALTIAACGHSSDNEESGEVSSPASTSAPAKPAQTGPIKGPTAPLSDYASIADEPLWVAYAYYARTNEPLTDEQKLDLFSPAYRNESDAFKKRDLAASELPKIEAKLKAFGSERFFYLDIARSPVALSELGPYDFQTKSFPLLQCGTLGAGVVRGIQGALFEDPKLCTVKVKDEGQAREIESLRGDYHLTIKLRYFFRIDGIDPANKQLNGTITHVHAEALDYTDKHTIATSDVSL